jgi:hypothetical protein
MPGRKPPRRMAADGDMGSPSEIDTPPSSGAAPPSPDQDMDSPQITPEMVDYHTGEENCGGCMYMGQDGTCAVLKMPVGESDWCKAFTPQGGGSGDPSASPEGMNPEMMPS